MNILRPARPFAVLARVQVIVIAVTLAGSAAASAATFGVNTTTDSVDAGGCVTVSVCSLRDAVIASNATTGPNTITLQAATYKLTIAPTSAAPPDAAHGDLDIVDQSVTISGQGSASTTIDGNGLDRIFHVECHAVAVLTCADTTGLSISGVTLTGGAPAPTAFPAPGPNDPTTWTRGGAIQFDTAGTLSVAGSVLSNNHAAGGQANLGGAIEIADSGGTLSVTGSTFSSNVAGDTNGTDAGFGGAIFAGNPYNKPPPPSLGTHISLTDSTFTGNDAMTPTLGSAEGGAVDQRLQQLGNGSGGIDETMSVTRCTFTGNKAGGTGGTASAGALYVQGTTSIVDSTFAANTAGGGDSTYGDGQGGAIQSVFDNLSITGSRFTGNTAGTAGSGSASGDGGAVNVTDSNLTVTASTLSGNTAEGQGARGGAIYSAPLSTQTVSIVRSTVSGNTAGGAGGYGEGGGIYGATTNVVDSTIANNTAGGGGASGDGGGIDAVTTLESSTVAGNTVGVGTGTAGGGGIDGDLTARNSILSANTKAGDPNNCSGGTITSLGHNILGSNVNCVGSGGSTFNGPGDKLANPMLGPLQDNGGPGPTMALTVGSPAIDHADSANCQPTDERGVTRPQGAGCDVGAYEYSPPTSSAALPNGCSKTGAIVVTVTPAAGGAAATAVHYTVDGGTEQRAVVSGHPANATVQLKGAGAHVLQYWGESQGGAIELPKHTVQVTVCGFVPPPKLSGLSIHPGSFLTANSGQSILVLIGNTCKSAKAKHSHKHLPRCATVKYNDSKPALTTFTVKHSVAGAKVHGKCKSIAHHKPPKHAKACTLWVAVNGSFQHHDSGGANSFRFSGRLNGHSLPAGSYQLRAIPKLGSTGAIARIDFKIL